MKDISFPLSEAEVRHLRTGDEVMISGLIVTARDSAHRLMVKERPDFIRPFLREGAIYHCGPVMKKVGNKWAVVTAGPTTSTRQECYESVIIKEYSVRAIIGKGGMGSMTSLACQEVGAVYLHVVGGAAALIADSVKNVKGVFMLDQFGMAEAFWLLEVENLKAVVTMDSGGNSLHDDVFRRSKERRDTLVLPS